MSNASNLSTLANVLDDGSDGQFLKSTGSGGVAFDTVAAGAVVYATADLLPLSGFAAGDMAYVTSTNRFYINNGSGWYSISLVNTNPNITSVADASSGTTPFTLATDQTATVITITAADPEDVPLTYGYSVTSGSLNGSTVTQGTGSNTNVFTVTPHASQDATFTITFTASDGINQATSANAFSLTFITTVTDSNHTTLLVTTTPKNATVYRYFKFIPQALRSASDYQICEFELTDGSSYYSPTDAEQLYRSDDSDGDDYVAGQNVAASIDGNTGTKIYNGSWDTKYYLYDMGSSFNTVLTGWRYITGDDVSGRDPVSWTLLGSTNNSDWVLLDQRVNETITTSRSTATQDFIFNATNQAFFNAGNTNYPIEVNGDAHAGTFSPYRSGGYSTFFNTATSQNAKIDLPTTVFNSYSTSNASTSNFTIQAMIYPTGYADTHSWGNSYAMAVFAKGNVRVNLGINSSGYLIFHHYGTSANDIVGSSQVPLNEWSHVAIICTNGSLSLKLNGTQVGTSTWTGVVDPSGSVYVGAHNYTSLGSSSSIQTGDNGYFKGYIADLKISGVAETITAAPTERAVSDSNTQLLLCHLPYIVDGSSNSVLVTPEDVSTKPFSPYDNDEYSATDHGGSVYFDRVAYNSGACITVADHNDFTLGTSDWTVKFWVYHNELDTSAGNSYGYFSNYYFNTPGGFGLKWMQQHGNKPVLEYMNSGAYAKKIFDFVPSVKTWYYYELTCSSSSVTFKVNGDTIGTQSVPDLGNPDRTLIVGAASNGSSAVENYLGGYIADFQYVIGGTASESSVPIAPMSTDTNSKLHIKGTDASIIDKSQGSNLKLVGNTTGSTGQAKFSNTKSMYFDGSGDYIPIITDFFYEKNTSNASTTKFTIETWVYHTARLTSSGYNHIFQTIVGLGNVGLSFGIGPSGNLKFYHASSSTNVVTSTSTISLNTWTHIAVIVDGSQGSSGVTLKINGTTDGTGSWSGISTSQSDQSTPYSSPHFTIGRYPDSFQSHQQFQGYLQDLRISSYARTITSAPTAPLEG